MCDANTMNYVDRCRNYSGLAKTLRESPPNRRLMWTAADTIEELQASLSGKDKVCRIVEKDGETELFIENRWISVSERLPEAKIGHYSEDVLVVDCDGCVAICNYYKGCDGFSAWAYSGINEITHWMPLPAPPKEDE